MTAPEAVVGDGDGSRTRGRSGLLRVFYMLAQVSVQYCPSSRAYYDRKRAEGKRHQAVLALARRRLNVLRAMIRDTRLFQPALAPAPPT